MIQSVCAIPILGTSMRQWLNRWNDEVGWLKRFFDGFKNALCCVIDFDNGQKIAPAFFAYTPSVEINNHYRQSMPCLKRF
jgi:hypothetical protein